MATTAKAKSLSVEEKLNSLNQLQQVDSKIDDIQRLKGELPMEVADLEDEIEGLNSRIEKLQEEIGAFEDQIVERKNIKKDAEKLIEKYTKQQNNVKNNREFDALTKEIELQNLEIQISDKRVREAGEKIEQKNEYLDSSKELIASREEDLKAKNDELDKIIKQTEKDEKKLQDERDKLVNSLDKRLVKAYSRIRNKYHNGLAVVNVQRDACGGCFSAIPPQVQLEIGAMKRVIQCENCARVLVPFGEEDEE